MTQSSPSVVRSRSSWVRDLVLTLATLALVSVPMESDARPLDIQLLGRAATAIEKHIQDTDDAGQDAVLEAMVRVRNRVARRLVTTRGYRGIFDLDAPQLKDAFARPLQAEVDKAFSNPSVQLRRSMLYDVLIAASSEERVDGILALQHGLKPPGSFVTQKHQASRPGFDKQVTLNSDTPRLEFRGDHSMLVMDLGGAGSGNGVIDAGEWVHLEFAVMNVSELPYFSSSAFVKSESECLWVPPSREFLFPELPPNRSAAAEGKKTRERSRRGRAAKRQEKVVRPGNLTMGKIATWVYLSSECRDGQRAGLRLIVKDSHRTKGTQHIMRATLLVQNRTRAAAVNFLVDHDIPGWSDGDRSPPLGPGRQVELSHAVRYQPSSFVEGFMGWGVRAEHRSLLVSAEFRNEEPLIRDPQGNSKLLPGDDYDIEFVSSRPYDLAVGRVGRTLGWESKSDARMLAATDVMLLYEDPDPLEPSAKQTVTRTIKQEVTCSDGFDNDEDGQTDCDDADCVEETICICGPKVKGPVASERVISLVEQFTRITPAPATPKTPEAKSAISVQGYELTFDAGSFRKRYECLAAGIPLSRCGQPKCVDCKKKIAPPRVKTITVEVPAETGPENVRHVAYRFRYYFALPLVWRAPVVKEICNNKIDDDKDGQYDCMDSDCYGSSYCKRSVERICNDGVDNDDDGQIDCMDMDCARTRICNPIELCTDGIDNDKDRKIDCEDPDCEWDDACRSQLPYVWLDLGFQSGVYGYKRGVSDETFSLPGFMVHASLAVARLFSPDAPAVTTHVSTWYGTGNDKASSGFALQLGYVFEPVNWLEFEPHLGFSVHDFDLEVLGDEPVTFMEPEMVSGFVMGLSIRILPFDVPLYFALDGGFHYLGSVPRGFAGINATNVTPIPGTISAGVGYRIE